MGILVRRILSLLCLFGLTSCGSSNGGSGGPPLPDTTRYATFDAIHSFIQSLPGTDPAIRRQSILDYFKTRPEFEASGANEDGSLWGRFTDGRLYVLIANEDDPTRSFSIPYTPQRHTATRAFSELPTPLQARVIKGIGPNERNRNDEIKALLSTGGYTVLNATASVDDLLTVNGDGVFYILGHGGNGYDQGGNFVFGITSSSLASPAEDTRLTQLWFRKELGYADVTDTRYIFFDDPKTYYLITEEFVKAHMHFGPNSVVFVGACNSANPNHISFSEAFRNNGAGVFIGWTANTQRRDNIAAALYVFDRLLGANAESPAENPDQRAFDYGSIKADMAAKGLDRSDLARLKFLPGSGGESGLLAPSIRFMTIDEFNETVTLFGKFGTQQGRVEVNGNVLTIKTWDKERIEARLPRTGPGSAGEVKVISQERESNPRMLTDWKGDFNVSFHANDTLQWGGPLHIHFRADIGSFRVNPGEAPITQPVLFRAVRDTSGTWTASGESISPGPPASGARWSGTSTLVPGEYNPATKNVILCHGQILPDSHGMKMVLFALAAQGMIVTDVRTGITASISGTAGELDGPFSSSDPLPSLTFNLDSSYSIPAGSHTQIIDTPPNAYPLKVEWNQITPTYPPNTTDARSAKSSR